MVGKSDQRAGAAAVEKAALGKASLPSQLFAEENEFDRRMLWRIGTWGVATLGFVALAFTANQWAAGLRRDQIAAADMARQAQQLQALAKSSQNETRRLASAIETLNGDRDRLFARVTTLEQGLDSVTGSIAKQNASAAAAPKPWPPASAMPSMMTPPATAAVEPPPAGQAVASLTLTPPVGPIPAMPRTDIARAEPAPDGAVALPQAAGKSPLAPMPAAATSSPALGAPKSMMGPPDPAAAKLAEPTPEATGAPTVPDAGSAEAKDQDKPVVDADAAAAVQRTEFAVELGGANSIEGLRNLWRGLLKSNNAELAELRPIIMLRERISGGGMQLRLAAGPLQNAAEAARICASLTASRKACDTTVFDGQRLAVTNEPPAKPVDTAKPQGVRRNAPRHTKKDEPPATPPQETSTFSSLFGGRR